MTSFLTNLIARERQEGPLVQPRPVSRFEAAPLTDGLGAYPLPIESEGLIALDVTAPATPQPHAVARPPAASAPSPPQPFSAPVLPSPPIPYSHAPSTLPPAQPQQLIPSPPLDLPLQPPLSLARSQSTPAIQPHNSVSSTPSAPPIPPPFAPSGSAVPYPEPQLQLRSPEAPLSPLPLTPYPPPPSDTASPITLLTQSEVVTRLEPLVTSPGPSFPPTSRQAEFNWPGPAAPPVDSSPPAPPTINVTIGRIEIRAQTTPGPIPRPARPSAPIMDLEKYLELRSGGQL